MEYLTTYGWAILVIAVVLAALFELGVFNANNLGPRAQPGSCHIYRPDGPGTTAFISAEGLCNGELPEYTALYNPGGYFWGNFSSFGSNTAVSITESGWVKTTGGDLSVLAIGTTVYGSNPGQASFDSYADNQLEYHGCYDDYGVNVGGNLYDGNWYFVAMTYSSSTGILTMYVDSKAVSNTWGASQNLGNNVVWIGRDLCDKWTSFAGSYEANVQLYNTSLSSNNIQALYYEGIGGAPIKLQNLVGWWPLNGNAQDYSGNNNNLKQGAVSFTGSWTSGYTAP